MDNLVDFRSRRAAELKREALQKIPYLHRMGRIEFAEKLESQTAQRLSLLTNQDIAQLFRDECRARRMIGEARRTLAGWRTADDPEKAKRVALERWNEGRVLLAQVLSISQLDVSFRHGF